MSLSYNAYVRNVGRINYGRFGIKCFGLEVLAVEFRPHIFLALDVLAEFFE